MERGKIEERTVRKLIVDRKGEMRQIAMDLKQKFEMSIANSLNGLVEFIMSCC
jgi:hypothetical protein